MRHASFEPLEPRALFSGDIPVLIVPDLGQTLPAKLSWDSALDYLRGKSIDPDDLADECSLDVYRPLIEKLADATGLAEGENVFYAAYDGRLPLAPTDRRADGWINLDRVNFNDAKYRYGVEYLRYWIEEARRDWVAEHSSDEGFQVDIIAHGSGGLLVRSFVQSKYYKRNYPGLINKVATLGTPHAGTVDAFVQQSRPLQSMLSSLGLDDDWDDVLDFAGVGDTLLGAFLPGLSSLLPTFSFISTAAGGMAPDASTFQNTLLGDLNVNPKRFAAGVADLLSVGSTGVKTRSMMQYFNGKSRSKFSLDGDGVVLAVSSILPGAGLFKLFQGATNIGLPGREDVLGEVVDQFLLAA